MLTNSDKRMWGVSKSLTFVNIWASNGSKYAEVIFEWSLTRQIYSDIHWLTLSCLQYLLIFIWFRKRFSLVKSHVQRVLSHKIYIHFYSIMKYSILKLKRKWDWQFLWRIFENISYSKLFSWVKAKYFHHNQSYLVEIISNIFEHSFKKIQEIWIYSNINSPYTT